MKRESDIQKIIFDYCTKLAQKYDIVVFSIPNESLMTALRMFNVDDKTTAMLVNHFKKMGLVPGIPDLGFLYLSKTTFFEVKKPGEVPGKVQKIVHKAIRKTGHEVFTVISLEEFKEIIESKWCMWPI